MEEQKQNIEQDYNSVPREEVIKPKKNWLLIIGAIVLFLVLVGGGLFWWSQGTEEREEKREAEALTKYIKALEDNDIDYIIEYCEKEEKGTWYKEECLPECSDENFLDGRCVRLPCPVEGVNIKFINSWFRMDELGGDLEIMIGNNGFFDHRPVVNERYYQSIISEKDYKNIYDMFMDNDELLVSVDEISMLKDAGYYNYELARKEGGYTLVYGYYPEGLEEELDNLKFKGMACNLSNCPQEITEIMNKMIDIAPSDYSDLDIYE